MQRIRAEAGDTRNSGPAEELDAFDDHIVGTIEVVASHS
jgi:hypothetical protein